MHPRTLFNLSGLAAIVGGLTFSVGNLMHPLDHSAASLARPLFGAAHITFGIGGLIAVLGLPGLYVWQMRRAGTFGLVGTVTTMLGLMWIFPGAFYEAFVANTVGPVAAHAIESGPSALFSAIGGLGFLLGGHVLLSIALFRARTYPRPAAILMLLCAVALAVVGAGGDSPAIGVAIIAATALLGVAHAWLGASLIAQVRAEATVVPAATGGRAAQPQAI